MLRHSESIDNNRADVLKEIKTYARNIFSGARGSHAWDHTLRVHCLCERIGRAEGADMIVVGAAAYLHDIGRMHQDSANGKICHARHGAHMAGSIISDMPFTAAQKDNILHCIQTHRFRGEAAPESLEARVLFDADKLDAIGAVGVARAYLFAGEVGARLHNIEVPIEETRSYSPEDTGYREYRFKLCNIKDRMLTPTGRKLALARHRFMEAFFDRFLREYEGKE